ncbi:hypothetical protein ElyMa_000370200 [Elysia marginata]|uniref:Uncharacterized protein n=1 Tax=Elysia marginata TaxID=1093978 RepID=A0AAV4FH60_9GAST|nr:hypothetical protein ElyMa_000370200 [Elysia marginata]
MGNKQGAITSLGEEMGTVRYYRVTQGDASLPRTVDQLWEDCLALKNGFLILSEAIDDLFEDDDSEETTPELETRLQGLVKINQDLMGSLTLDLERNAKLVCQKPESNENLITLVREIVSVINSYMTMLIRNIRKLRQLIVDMLQDSPKSVSSVAVKGSLKNGKRSRLVYDVISETQDVDAMLIQLQRTQRQREELERDIVTVLVCWRDFSSAMAAEETEPEVVVAAADSVAHGLAQLSK